MPATIISRGKATINGVAGSFDIIVYCAQQKLKGNQVWEDEYVKDVKGGDAASVSRNEHMMMNIGLKFLADTAAHAAVPIQTGSGVLSTLGQPFMAPKATVTISSAEFAGFNGVFSNETGTDIDMGNTEIAAGDYKLKRYADSTQNTLMTTAPS